MNEQQEAWKEKLQNYIQDFGLDDKCMELLWRTVIAFENYPFTTSGRGTRPGIEFRYTVSKDIGKSGKRYHFKVAAVLLICVPLIPGAIMMVQKIAKKLLSKYWDQYARLGSTFLENLQGMTTLKTYQADEAKNEQMNEESEHFRVVTMKVLTMQLNSIIIMDFFTYGGAALGIALAGKTFADGQIGLAAVIFMILLSADFFLPMRRLGSYFHVAMNGMAASDRIFRFLSESEPVERKKDFPEGKTDVELKDVCFSYTADREVLHEVSLRMEDGKIHGRKSDVSFFLFGLA